MNAGYIIALLAIGLIAGMLSSLIGIGGGIVIVPALVFFFGMAQIKAQGISLAMLLPPIGILGVWQYYKAGQVDLKLAGILCVGFILGSYFGGRLVVNMDKDMLRKIFGIVLLVIAVKFLFFDKSTDKKAQQPDTGNAAAK